MSPEIITILAIGIAVIGVQMTTFIYMLNRMDRLQHDISEAREEFRQEIGEVKERVARLEGILIGRLEVGNGTLTQTGED